MNYDTNQFPATDPDRHAIWEMLVRRDIDAFLSADWEAVSSDFIEVGFMGIDGRLCANPDTWKLSFPDLGCYRDTWLGQARGISMDEMAADTRKALFDATTLRDIDVQGDSALLHKKFDGALVRRDGTRLDRKSVV